MVHSSLLKLSRKFEFDFPQWCRGLDITRGYWTRRRPNDFGARASGLNIIRGYATRSRPVDIGARARQLQARRLWTIALGGTVVAGFIIVVLNTFQDNLMFYITPSQVCYLQRKLLAFEGLTFTNPLKTEIYWMLPSSQNHSSRLEYSSFGKRYASAYRPFEVPQKELNPKWGGGDLRAGNFIGHWK